MKTFVAISTVVFTVFITGLAFACDPNEVKSLQALYQTSTVISLGVNKETGRYKIVSRDGRVLYVETDRSSAIPTIKKQVVLSNK
jgi:hypothetical protein